LTPTHRVCTVGADIDTDQPAPGAYMKRGVDGVAPRCLETVRPEFAGSARPGDLIAAGPNFGIGSSREQNGEVVTLDPARTPRVGSADGSGLACDPIPDFMLERVAAGGLLNQLRQRPERSA